MTKKLLMNMQKVLVLGVMILFSGALGAQSFVGSRVLNAAKEVSVDITTFVMGDSASIIITGPSTVWHAVGFGGSSMNGTYCIVIDGQGNASERKLGNHNGGSQLSASITSSSTSVMSGTRTTVIKRPLTGLTSNHFTFPGNGNPLSVIWAYGSGANFNSHSGRGASLVTFSPNNTVSIAENELQQAQLYPNPATNRITVDFASVTEGGKMYLKDMSGRILKVEAFQAAQILNWDLSQEAGLYIIELQSVSGESASFKILVK